MASYPPTRSYSVFLFAHDHLLCRVARQQSPHGLPCQQATATYSQTVLRLHKLNRMECLRKRVFWLILVNRLDALPGAIRGAVLVLAR